ncbi:hypothetical protein ZYGR_0A03330 [Zygosaccharomyces rouxii]|uniref:ZYRO0A07568p n=2 Tax=Zygosaccharomyces rouxii TaxID=4956 RepID=C5DQ03_ZYGRC|nr:uncharacterized protein ZYRO0A07568g [Zygosaccharomyces rouxii]KAH9198715.1 hypothetical protein LQ764DRAFT_235700 [Zygosaccharomyces rouxii]GAV46738.1 hypothetical protein ZYGR_0A03330 [Zygosaccharomyces rouxii]CAR25764.1 ZYRO0A07568p [Zygosaccharomyces rouxii]
MSELNDSRPQRGRWVSWWYSRGSSDTNGEANPSTGSNSNNSGNNNNNNNNDNNNNDNDTKAIHDEGRNVEFQGSADSEMPNEVAKEQPTGWYSSIMSKMPSIPFVRNRQEALVIDSNARYSQLNDPQVEYLEVEAKETIVRRNNTWCWYENLTDITAECSTWGDRPGVVSVYSTGSAHCPLPLPHYPISDGCRGYHVYIKNSLILPSDSPSQTLHEQSWLSKAATEVKNYYNFPNEKHLYLKKITEGLLRERKVVIISLVGNLPEKYKKLTLGDQRSAHYLATKLALSLQREMPSKIESLSFECPLDSKDLTIVFQECIELLKNWTHILHDADAIFVESVYHAVPLAISLTKYILQNHESFQFRPTIPVGILAIESSLQGYRFWDHSVDLSNSSEQDYHKIQQNREKQLFQGASKVERETLSKLTSYRKLNSDESRLVQKDLNWLLTNWGTFRLNLFGKLFDNFMTVSQKLAIDYVHPKIFRHLWCDGRSLGLDTRNPEELGIPDVNIRTPEYENNVSVPKNRRFEISLIGNILLALNLGNTKFVPILKLISPFFISRSFNENTISPTLRKATQQELKIWTQEMDARWKILNSSDQIPDELPEEVSTVYKFLKFSHYQNLKNPDIMTLYCEIYDDDCVYKTFIENTMKTRSPLNRKHLVLLNDHSTPQSILNTVNQYDLVWKFHECLSDYMKLRNLPSQMHLPNLFFVISLDRWFWKPAQSNPTSFRKDNSEALARLQQLWESYQDWDPPTRGLKQLRNILSVLSLYSDSTEMLHDIEHK